MSSENLVLVIGYIATVITTLATLPQIIRAIRTRDVTGVSLVTYVMFIIANMCWITYGFLVRGDGKIDYPIVIGDFISLSLNLTMVVFKLISIKKGLKTKEMSEQ